MAGGVASSVPQTWRGMTVRSMAYSDVGPVVNFDEAGHIVFAPEWSYKMWVVSMFIRKPGTAIYIAANPFVCMLCCWTWSVNIVWCAIGLIGVFSLNGACILVFTSILHKRAVKLAACREKEIERGAEAVVPEPSIVGAVADIDGIPNVGWPHRLCGSRGALLARDVLEMPDRSVKLAWACGEAPPLLK
mmetsp:Transcript_8090/g.20707  ORF Transcript_8090/g.20707 Transcript_8090/m.20707 type:complete len:189 (+) Transcript_8090:129-695(+)